MAAGEEQLRLVLQAIDKTAAPIRAVNRRIESMLAPVRKVRNAMRSLAAEAGLPKLGAGFAKLTSVARNLALGAAAVGGGILEFTRRTAESVDELSEMTRQLGVGIAQFQHLQFAAENAGVGTEAFAASMRTLAKNVGALKLGTGPLAKHLGPVITKQLKAASGTGEALEVMLDALREITDPLERNAIAAKVFGRSGQSMALMAGLSSKALAELVAESKSFGEITSANASDAESLMDSLDRLKLVVSRLATSVASELFPDLRAASDQLRQWVAANRELIINRSAEAIRSFASGLREAGGFLTENIPKLRETIVQLGGLETVLKGIAAIALAPVVRVVIALSVAIGAVGSAILGTGAALAYLLIQFEKLTGIKDKILDVIDPLAAGSLVGRGLRTLGSIPSYPAARVVALPQPVSRPIVDRVSQAATRGRFDLVGDVNIRLDQRGARLVGASSSIPTVGFNVATGRAMDPQ